MDQQEVASVPPWLNKEFFEKTIRSSIPGHEVVNFQIKPAVDLGGHFCSELFKVSVGLKREGSGDVQGLQLIAKILPQPELRRRLIQESGIFTKEATVYSKILPKMEETLDNVFHNNMSFSPKYYQTCVCDNVNAIVLEDMAVSGFKGISPKVGLSEDQGKLVLKTIARFHAASSVILRNNPELAKPFQENNFGEKTIEAMQQVYGGVLESLADVVEQWPEGLDSKIVSVIRDMSEHGVAKMAEVTRKHDDDFNVLIHGDLWTNNVLFKSSDDKNEVKLIDYQQTHFTSPAVELQYFFHCSLMSDVRQNRVEELLRFYHEELMETLSLLGSNDGISFEELLRKYEEKSFIGLFTACTDLFLTMTEEDGLNIDDVLENKQPTKLESESCDTLYKKEFLKIVPYFQNLSLL